MRRFILFIVFASIVTGVVAVDVRKRKRQKRVDALAQQLDRLSVDIHADTRRGLCDFAKFHRSHQLTTELARLRGHPTPPPYPYKRTTGVIFCENLPKYLRNRPATAPSAFCPTEVDRAGRRTGATDSDPPIDPHR